MTTTKKLYAEIATMIAARENITTAQLDRQGWYDRHTKRLEFIEMNCLPSGSGIDNGCTIDLGRSKPERLVLTFGFHHMDENGYYTIWTHHEVIITPSLQFGYSMRITGKDHNGIKDYLYDVLSGALDGSFSEYLDGLMADYYGGE